MELGYVYKITSPTGRIYVGSTSKTPEKRWMFYHTLNCKGQYKLYNSFIKYGVENHIFSELWSGDITEMLKQEAILGRLHNVLNKNKGLNLRLPKESDVYCSISDETRKKISDSNKGKKRSEETRRKISLAGKGKIVSDETKLKLSKLNSGKLNGFYGKKHTEKVLKILSLSSTGRGHSLETREKISKNSNAKNRISKVKKKIKDDSEYQMSKKARLKMSKAKKGKVFSKEFLEMVSNINRIPVVQMDFDGNFIKEWPSAKDAGIGVGISNSGITACCKNKPKYKTAGGFKWKYK